MKIKYDIDNNCVSCEHCIHCGRGDYRYPVAIVCDKCEQDFEELYQTDDGYFCKDCLPSLFAKVSVEDIEDNMDDYEYEQWEKWNGRK